MKSPKYNKRTKTISNYTAPTANKELDLYSLCRWASLKEAIDLVGEKCEERNLDFETFELKPLDLLKYVDSMTDEMYSRILDQELC